MELTTDLNDIKICQTVTVGAGEFSTPAEVLQELITRDAIRREVKLGIRARHEADYEDPRMFFQENFIHLNKKRQEVNIAIVPVKTLMNEDERHELSFGEIMRRASKYGLEPCPQEVPIALSLLCTPNSICKIDKNLPLRNRIYVATQPFQYHNALVVLSNFGDLSYHLYSGLEDFFHSHYDLMAFKLK